jgi:hypothetical protein
MIGKIEERTEKIDRSFLQSESLELFSETIKNPATRDLYEIRLIDFLKE